MEHLAELLKAAADPTRLRILRLLHEAKQELCGCELVDCLEQPQYNLSKHLRVLRSAGFITSRKDGQWVYFKLAEGAVGTAVLLLQLVAVTPDIGFRRVQRNLRRRLGMRSDGKCLIGAQSGRPHRATPQGGPKRGR